MVPVRCWRGVGLLLWVLLASLAAARSAGLARAESTYTLADGVELRLLDAQQGAKVLLDDRDAPFFARLTTIDMAARMGRALSPAKRGANLQQFRRFVAASARNWSRAEEQAVVQAARVVQFLCADVLPSMVPNPWRFVKTDGREEGGASYARGGCVVLSEEAIREAAGGGSNASLVSTIVEQTFQLYSRQHPERAETLYGAIGFHKVPKLRLGAFLEARRLTTPGATTDAYVIEASTSRGRRMLVTPVSYARFGSYVPGVTSLQAYLVRGLFEVTERDGVWTVKAAQNRVPHQVSPATIGPAREPYDASSVYRLNPGEMLARLVAMIVTRGAGVGPGGSIDVVDRVANALAAK